MLDAVASQMGFRKGSTPFEDSSGSGAVLGARAVALADREENLGETVEVERS